MFENRCAQKHRNSSGPTRVKSFKLFRKEIRIKVAKNICQRNTTQKVIRQQPYSLHEVREAFYCSWNSIVRFGECEMCPLKIKDSCWGHETFYRSRTFNKFMDNCNIVGMLTQKKTHFDVTRYATSFEKTSKWFYNEPFGDENTL